MKNITNTFSCWAYKVLALSFVLCILIAKPSMAQEEEEEDKFSMNVTLNSDAFFGFYPFFTGSYAINDGIDFTFYGILWSGGTGIAWGNWTEFGMGIGIPVGDALYINPQVGLLNGSLLSGGSGTGGGTPQFAEGIVPNLTVTYDDGTLEGELYGGYYAGFDYGETGTSDFLHWWVSSGYKLNSFMSFGAHFEQLQLAGGEGVDETANIYVALGPYVKFADPKGGAFGKFMAGPDLRSDSERDNGGPLTSFFKLTAGFSF